MEQVPAKILYKNHLFVQSFLYKMAYGKRRSFKRRFGRKGYRRSRRRFGGKSLARKAYRMVKNLKKETTDVKITEYDPGNILLASSTASQYRVDQSGNSANYQLTEMNSSNDRVRTPTVPYGYHTWIDLGQTHIIGNKATLKKVVVPWRADTYRTTPTTNNENSTTRVTVVVVSPTLYAMNQLQAQGGTLPANWIDGHTTYGFPGMPIFHKGFVRTHYYKTFTLSNQEYNKAGRSYMTGKIVLRFNKPMRWNYSSETIRVPTNPLMRYWLYVYTENTNAVSDCGTFQAKYIKYWEDSDVGANLAGGLAS